MRIALIQYEVQDPDAVGTDADRVERFFREAAAGGARLIVAPETCFYRYSPWERSGVTMLDLAAAYRGLTVRFTALARALGVSLVIGLREPSGLPGKPVFNTALCVGPDGAILRRQRKIVPSLVEQAWTAPGEPGVFTSAAGRPAVMICKTAKAPEWSVYNTGALDLFVLVAGDKDGTSFGRFGEICRQTGAHGVLCNQICGDEPDARRGNSAWAEPDGTVRYLGAAEGVYYQDWADLGRA